MRTLLLNQGTDWLYPNARGLRLLLTSVIGEVTLPDRPGPRWTYSFVSATVLKVALYDPLINERTVRTAISEYCAIDQEALRARQEYFDRLTAQRDQSIAEGVNYKNTVFDSDERSAFRLLTTVYLVDSGIVALPEGFSWRSKVDENIPMTLPELKELAGLMFVNSYMAFLQSWAQKDAP